jgi:hypothetical protein
LNETVVKILSFKSVDPSMLTYMLDRADLKDAWKKVIESMPLEPKNGNGRVTNLEESVNLIMSVLTKIVKRELGLSKGINELTDKQILEEYLATG